MNLVMEKQRVLLFLIANDKMRILQSAGAGGNSGDVVKSS